MPEPTLPLHLINKSKARTLATFRPVDGFEPTLTAYQIAKIRKQAQSASSKVKAQIDELVEIGCLKVIGERKHAKYSVCSYAITPFGSSLLKGYEQLFGEVTPWQ